MSSIRAAFGKLAQRAIDTFAAPETCCSKGSEIFWVSLEEANSAPSCCGASAAPSRPANTASEPKTEYTVRPAAAADLDAARAVLAAASLPLDGLDDQFGSQYAVAVGGEGRVIGVAGFEIYGRFGLLRSVAVDPSLRGKGVGEALMRNRIAAAWAHDLEALYALTTTAADYFPRFGFAAVRRDEVPAGIQGSPEFGGICPCSAAVLRLVLDPGA